VEVSGEGNEAILLQRPFAGGDLLGAFDHGVDRLVVVLGTFERVVAGHPPVTRILPGAHPPGGLDRRTVGQVVPVPLDMRFELVGNFCRPGTRR
jgi:hypothetical protein